MAFRRLIKNNKYFFFRIHVIERDNKIHIFFYLRPPLLVLNSHSLNLQVIMRKACLYFSTKQPAIIRYGNKLTKTAVGSHVCWCDVNNGNCISTDISYCYITRNHAHTCIIVKTLTEKYWAPSSDVSCLRALNERQQCLSNVAERYEMHVPLLLLYFIICCCKGICFWNHSSDIFKTLIIEEAWVSKSNTDKVSMCTQYHLITLKQCLENKKKDKPA